MSSQSYRTAPVPSRDLPPGIPYIVGNEAAERFSFYGMRAILTVYMTSHLGVAAGAADLMDAHEAQAVFHSFVAAVYFFPFLGALLADVFLGKYRTILLLSMVYCAGHFVLALVDSPWAEFVQPRWGLFFGLALIALGSGGIKGCVTAHVGDQFGKTNQYLMAKAFGWFYFSINLGSLASQLLTPYLLDEVGPWAAFGVPGVLMLIATFVFWLGRHRFIHVPAGGMNFIRESLSKEGLAALGQLLVLYAFVAMFWALYDQTGSSWVLQAQKMDRVFDLSWLGLTGDWAKWEVRPSQVQAVNPFLILLFIPLFSYIVYPLAEKVITLTPLRKIGVGLAVTAGSFALCAMIQRWIDAGHAPSLLWQVLAYILITAGEVMVSITGLEFSYTQAPRTMKSFVMAIWFLAISAGNLLAAQINALAGEGSLQLDGARYFQFFTLLMLGTTVLYIVAASFYRGKTFIHDEQT